MSDEQETIAGIEDDIRSVAWLVEQAWQLFGSEAKDPEAMDEEQQNAHQQALAAWLQLRTDLLEQPVASAPLQQLQRRFALPGWQVLLLLMTALPALEPRYRRLYRDLNPTGQGEPALDWLLSLLASSRAEKQQWCRELSGACALVRFRLLIVPDDASHWLSAATAIAADTLALLLGQPLAPNQHSCLDLVPSAPHSLLPPELPLHGNCLQLVGSSGSGRTSLAQSMAKAAGRPLVRLDNERLWQFNEPVVVLADALRFVTLADAELLWPDGLTALVQQPQAAQQLDDWLQTWPQARLWLMQTTATDWPQAFLSNALATQRLTLPSEQRSVGLWQAMIKGRALDCQAVDWHTVTRRYRLLPAEIMQIVAGLDSDQPLSTESVLQCCLARTPESLSGLATRCDPDHDLQELVLAEDTEQQLQEICERFRFRQVLCDRGVCRLSGLNILFTGPPGTGKTLAAEALAGSLELPLYRVNLANIASKWIGETEKHLDRLFDEVTECNGILFFDEADALFGKRSDAKSSHDKNANMGVSYLLQRVEQFQGLLVLASNFKGNIDKAFLRRLHFSVEFARPDADERQALWQRWLDKVPVSDRVCLEQLARRLELTGAQVRNITQQALCLALADDETRPEIQPDHLIKAIRREFQKIDNGFLAEQQLAGWLSPATGSD